MKCSTHFHSIPFLPFHLNLHMELNRKSQENTLQFQAPPPRNFANTQSPKTSCAISQELITKTVATLHDERSQFVAPPPCYFANPKNSTASAISPAAITRIVATIHDKGTLQFQTPHAQHFANPQSPKTNCAISQAPTPKIVATDQDDNVSPQFQAPPPRDISNPQSSASARAQAQAFTPTLHDYEHFEYIDKNLQTLTEHNTRSDNNDTLPNIGRFGNLQPSSLCTRDMAHSFAQQQAKASRICEDLAR